MSSANPKYEYIGKGLAELISFELSKSKSVTLIEREKRTQLLEEMEFSLTDLTDPGKQLEVGKLQSAKYMVFGELIDVETGEVVWRDKLDESLTKYGRIAGYFAESILNYMKVEVAASTVKAVEKKKAKNEEAAVALSNAIASYDKKENVQAKKSLERARRLDPGNQVVNVYLQKLAPTSAKYKVQLEIFGPSANPAVLGMIRQDKIYSLISQPTVKSIEEMKPVGDNYEMGEQNMSTRIGAEFPLGGRLGMAAEFASGSFDKKITAPFSFVSFENPTASNYFHDRETNLGGTLSLGYKLLDILSLGAGLHLYKNTIYAYGGPDQYIYDTSVQAAGDWGFLVRNPGTRWSLTFMGSTPCRRNIFSTLIPSRYSKTACL